MTNGTKKMKTKRKRNARRLYQPESHFSFKKTVGLWASKYVYMYLDMYFAVECNVWHNAKGVAKVSQAQAKGVLGV